MSEVDVDKLYDDAMNETGSSEIPMDNVTEQATEPAVQAIPELEFNHKGKQIKTAFNDPKLQTWASQGYDYAQRMQEFHTKMEQFENQRREFSQIESRYRPIEDWAKANPDKWNSLFENWKREHLSGNGQQANAQLPPEVQQKLQKYDEYINKQEQKEQEQIVKQEDSELDAEVKSVMEKYPHIDFSAKVHDGKSLEYRVVEYGIKKNINSFEDAFYAFNHKNLFNQAEQKGKESLVQDIQKKTKLGILGKSSTPTRASGRAENVESKSYDDLLQEAKREYNIG